MLSRRKFVGSCLAGGAFFSLREVLGATAQVSIGAIRWDPWYSPSDNGARVAVENALGPAKWQARAPACATIRSSEKIDFSRCGTQSQIEKEIVEAHNAGLSYWAYVWYGPAHQLQSAWRLHRAAKSARKVKWCTIFSSYALFMREMQSWTLQYAEYFGSEDYQKVLTDRPLIYLISDTTPPTILAAAIKDARKFLISAGVGDPYIVLLCGAIRHAATKVGADAIGIYSKANSAPVDAPFSDLANSNRRYWTTLVEAGDPVVPTALTGADRRPRVERPVPWEVGQPQVIGDNHYYRAGSPQEIAAHIGEMVTWIKENPYACPAQTGLIYSWDEHDEGGSTLNPSLGQGSAILDAVGEVLKR